MFGAKAVISSTKQYTQDASQAFNPVTRQKLYCVRELSSFCNATLTVS